MIIELSVLTILKTEKLWKDILYQVLLTLPRNSTSSLPNHLRVWTSILKQDYALWSAMFRTGTHWSALIWIYLRLWEESEPSPIHLANKVVHIFNTKATDHYTTFEDMKLIVDEEVKAAQERADMLNNAKLSEAAIKQQVNEIKKVGVESYLSYQENKFIINDMVAKLQLYSYYIATVVYQSDKSLRETYAQSGIVTTKGKWHIAPEKFVKELIAKPTFRELHKRYCEIKANPMTFDLQSIDIEHEYPILGRAYRQLGVKELKRLRTIKSIQEALGEA